MKQLINLDNCYSDYFSGHHNRVLVASYDKHTTVSEILEQIESDSWHSEIIKEYDGFSLSEFNKAMILAYDNNFDNLKNLYMPDCDYSFDESDSDYLGDGEDGCTAYFTIVDSDTGE